MTNPYRAAAEAAKPLAKPTAPTFTVADVSWIRSRRSIIRTEQQLDEFQDRVADLAAFVKKHKGTTVKSAIGMTVLAIILGLVIIGLGMMLMDFAVDYLDAVSEDSSDV